MKQLLVAGLLMVATSAQALECRVVDPAQRFVYAEESASDVVIVMGQFDVAGNELPGCEGPGEVSYAMVSGHFVGQGLTQDGFTAAMAAPFLVRQDCMSPSPETVTLFSETNIVFLDVTDRGYLLSVGDCASSVYPADPATISQLTACMRGESC